MMKVYLQLFFIMVFPLFFSACTQTESPLMGIDDDVYIVMENNEFASLKTSLSQSLERTIITPQREKLFNLQKISPDQLERIKERKNIVFASLLNRNSNTTKLMKALLTPDECKKLSDGSVAYIKKENLWSKDQLILFLGANSIEDLRKEVIDNQTEITSEFQKMNDKRMQSFAYNSKIEQKEIQGTLLKNYGWMLYIQPEFQMVSQNGNDNYVLFIANEPGKIVKVILVHWIDNASPDLLNIDSISEIRNSYIKKCRKYISDSLKMSFNLNSVKYDEINFKDRYAIFTQGLWDYNDKKKGGPFINYSFFDESTKRIYMLDAAVYAPKFYKKTIIQQMDGILQSFTTIKELNNDRKMELLNSVK